MENRPNKALRLAAILLGSIRAGELVRSGYAFGMGIERIAIIN